MQSVQDASTIIRAGTPETEFTVSRDLDLGNDPRSFAQSKYRNRLHRNIIESKQKIRYARLLTAAFTALLMASVVFSAYCLYNEEASFPHFTIFTTFIFTILSIHRMSTLKKWKHELYSNEMAQKGEALDQYASVRKNRLYATCMKNITDKFSHRQRKSIAIILALYPALLSIYLAIIDDTYYAILIIYILISTAVLFTLIWPGRKKTAVTVDSDT